ncbi:MAG: LamG-like jellyroll fold domain-containing protein, partial [Candidatus Dormibacteraceae bacterium]
MGQAFNLDHAAGGIDFGPWSVGARWTIAAWVRPAAVQRGRQPIIGAFGQDHDWGVVLQDGRFGTASRSPLGGNQSVSGGDPAQPSVWYHVAGTCDGTNTAIYVNGQLKASYAVDRGYEGTSSGVGIGYAPGIADDGFFGLVDEVAIFQRALSASEIASIYGAATVGMCPSVPTLTSTNIIQIIDPIAATSSSSPCHGGVAEAIDRNASTSFLSYDLSNPGMIIHPTAGATIVSAVQLTCSKDAPECDPASFVLEGSRDGGVSFTPIGQGALSAFPQRGSQQTIDLSNAIPYTTYKLTFPSVRNPGLANRLQVAEVALLGNSYVPSPGAATVQGPPQSQNVLEGNTATLNVIANGTAPVTYQWFSNGVALVGASSDSYITPPANSSMDGVAYSVFVSNELGSALSPNAVIAVRTRTNTAVPFPYLTRGGLRRGVFFNIGGSTIAALTSSSFFPQAPDFEDIVSTFEAPPLCTDFYGARLSGFLLPEVTSDYTFHLTADDAAELWLSTSQDPGQKRLVAWEDTPHLPREWLRDGIPSPSNISVPIRLEAGQAYYVEALLKQATGDDFLAIAWEKPGDPQMTNGMPPISGEFLAFQVDPQIVLQPSSKAVRFGDSVTLTAAAAGTEPLSYQWLLDGSPLAGATDASLTLTDINISALGHYSCVAGNQYGTATSDPAVISITGAAAMSEPILNPTNGHIYVLLQPRSWSQAEAAAVALGGHLATIDDDAEETWIYDTFATYHGVYRPLWIGLYDADLGRNETDPAARRREFVWASGDPVQYYDWSPSEPDDYRGRGEFYVEM